MVPGFGKRDATDICPAISDTWTKVGFRLHKGKHKRVQVAILTTFGVRGGAATGVAEAASEVSELME